VNGYEDRTLPNTILQILGTSLLGPSFVLLNDTQVMSEVALVRDMPVERTGVLSSGSSLEVNGGSVDYAFLGIANQGAGGAGSAARLEAPSGENGVAGASVGRAASFTLPGMDNLLSLAGQPAQSGVGVGQGAASTGVAGAAVVGGGGGASATDRDG